MRPKKKVVLLLMENEHELGRWRFILETRGYNVLAAPYLDRAALLLSMHLDVCAAMTNIPGDQGVDGLARAIGDGRTCPCLLFGARFIPADTRAAAIEMLEVPGWPLAARVMERLKYLTARKRGPKPNPRDPVHEMQPTVATLLEERDIGRTVAA